MYCKYCSDVRAWGMAIIVHNLHYENTFPNALKYINTMQMVQSSVILVTQPLWPIKKLHIHEPCHILWHHCHYIIMCAEVTHSKLSQNQQSS